jgi:conjugal transfer/entry exclusion protein
MMKKTILLGAAFLLSGSAWAFAVFDAANFLKNNITAYQSAQIEMRQYQNLMQMIRSNSAGLNDGNINNQAANLAKIRELYNATQNLQKRIGDSQSVFNNAQAMYGAGNYKSWSEFGSVIAKRKAAGESSAVNLVRSAELAQAQMMEANTAHSKLAASLSSVQGVTEASQATASAVGVLIGQNSSLLGMMSAQALETGRNLSKKQAQETEAENQAKSYIEQKNIELRAFNKALNK